LKLTKNEYLFCRIIAIQDAKTPATIGKINKFTPCSVIGGHIEHKIKMIKTNAPKISSKLETFFIIF
jgi:hypothetical protein